MFFLALLLPGVLILSAAVILLVAFRKTKEPEKIATIFAFVSVGSGVLCLAVQFCFPEYSGPGGIDYIGDAIVYGLKEPGAPVHIKLRTYGGTYTYVDADYLPK